MVRTKSKSKTFMNVVLFFAITLTALGVFKVNLELAEVVKSSSAFAVTLDKDPLLVTLKVGEFYIKFNGSRFGKFFNGVDAIIENIF